MLATPGPWAYSERFGPVTIALKLDVSSAGIDIAVAGWRIGGLELPRSLAPRSLARERVDDRDRFTIDVAVSLPALGRLVRYRGWLVPAPA